MSDPSTSTAVTAVQPSHHRLHISGIHHSTKASELVQRFSSFGTIVGGEEGVGGLGVDGNGTPRKFAFLTIDTVPSQIAKCTSMLNGSMWKGHKLRIAPAKPDYLTRLAAEREAEAAHLSKAKPRKRRKPNTDKTVGILSRNTELVTAANIAEHHGWILDTSLPVPTPIFPLVVRPSHSLPLPPKAVITSWTRETPKARAAKEARAAKRLRQGILPNALIRAYRVKIDVRKWGRKKIVFGDGSINKRGGGLDLSMGRWECLEKEEGEATEGGNETVQWVFRTKDGTIRRKENVRLTTRNEGPTTDNFTVMLDRMARPDPSTPLCAPVTLPSDLDHATSIPIVTPSYPKFELDLDPPSLSTATEWNRPRSISPPPFVPVAPRALIYNEEDTFALLASAQGEAEAASSRLIEQEAHLSMLKSLMKEEEIENKVELILELPKPKVEGFNLEDYDDDDFDFGPGRNGIGKPSIRLRGGASGKKPSKEVEEDSESSSDEDDDEDVEMVEAAPKSVTQKTNVEMTSLKAMFKPQEESTSFSLFSGFDLDLEPLERTPSPPPISYSTAAPTYQQPHQNQHQHQNSFVPPQALGRSNRAWVGTGPLTPFFSFPGERLSEKDLEEMGITSEKREKLREASRKVEEEGGRNFWKVETLEEIEAKHQILRESLRGQARKRHREAAKRVRKKGNTKRGTTGGGGGGAGEEVDE